MRLIDADDLLNSGYPTIYHTEFGDEVINIEDIKNAPTVDAIPNAEGYEMYNKGYVQGYERGQAEARPQGDLISREALKEAVKNNLTIGEYYPHHFIKLIDNAQTVEYTFEEAFQKTVCENRLYCPARPQGETNAEIFKQTFGIYATELWSMKETDFLEWLNTERGKR